MKLLGLAAILIGAMAVPAVAQEYPPAPSCSLVLSSSVVSPGETITASSSGPVCFAPGANVDLDFESAPVHLTNVTADANGQFSTQITIPSNASPGTHTIRATGTGADGSTLTISANVTVVTAAAARAVPAAQIPFTGSDTAPAVWAGLAALALGTIMVVGARRRMSTRGRETGSG